MKAVRILNPSRVVNLPKERDIYDKYIPEFINIPDSEYLAYTSKLATEAEAVNGCVPLDVQLFIKSNCEKLPIMAKTAETYMYCVTNSPEAERSFSLYKLIFSCRRRSLDEETIKKLVFLYFNQRVDIVNPEDDLDLEYFLHLNNV